MIERAEGCRLIDIDGRAYLDGASSMWCNVHGHNHPRIDAAIREQLDRVAHCTALGMGSDTTARLAKRLADCRAGRSGARVLFERWFVGRRSRAQDGVSILAAVRRRRSRKRRSTWRSATRITATRSAASASAGSRGFTRCSSRCCSMWCAGRCPIRRRLPPELTRSMRRAILPSARSRRCSSAHHEELAAVVIEPLVQCAAGMIMHPPGFLARRARAYTRSTTCC